MRRALLLCALLAMPFLMGQHRVTRLSAPANNNDDPTSVSIEQKSNEGFEVHLDEDDATDAVANNSCWELYDGANTATPLVSLCETGVMEISGNDIVRGSGAATWGPAFWATTLAGTTVCTNQGLTCVNAWNLGVGAVNCASVANPRVVYCQ